MFKLSYEHHIRLDGFQRSVEARNIISSAVVWGGQEGSLNLCVIQFFGGLNGI